MLTKEEIMEIGILCRQGLGIRAIARQLDISRNTVRSYLRGEAVTRPERRGPGRPRTLEPYEVWLRKRVAAAAPIRLPATALHREIRAMGYTGTDRTVRRFLATLYPPAPAEPVVRYETPPGRQAQMDWGEYRLGRQKVYSFVGVLGYSRWLYVEYVDSTCAEVLVACHRRMFQDFGGIPREMLYDNMRTVVARRDAYGRGRHRFHDPLWALANECGYRPVLCRPYRPRTKGKVERSIHYIANSFFYPLLTRLQLEGEALDLDRLNAEARLWSGSVANVRVHGTTGEPPCKRLAADQAAMQPFAAAATSAAEKSRWPRYRLQRSPREYDAVLEMQP
jgi:transposase